MSRNTQSAYLRAQKHKKTIRATAFASVVIVVLAVAAYLLVSAFSKPVLPNLSGNVIDVSADMGGLDKKEIHVKAGQPVTIRLTSLDNSHRITVGATVNAHHANGASAPANPFPRM
jgi:heme/copper-type cytochrome/quinol oxidase subunit 2